MPTGLAAIDAMTPIGRGPARILIIGDRQTGKTVASVTDAIPAQKETDIHCFYVGWLARRSHRRPWCRYLLRKHGAGGSTRLNISGNGFPDPPVAVHCRLHCLLARWRNITAIPASMP